MRVIQEQVALPDDKQYSSVLSPPLFLSLSLLITHAVSAALGQTDAIIANQHGLAALVTDNSSALVLRVIVFASFPLFLAARLVRRRGLALDRDTLQQPFYEQCYPTAVFALGLGVGTSLTAASGEWAKAAGVALILASVINYVIVEVRWFARSIGCGYLRAARSVAIGLLEGSTFLLIISFLFTR